MVPLDVTSDESVTGAVRLVRKHTDRLDVLINNAGAPGKVVAPADATADEIHSVYDTNVYGPIRVTHAFLPLLQAADHPRVVMVSSGGGSFAVVTDPEQPVSKMHELAYSSSKAALNMITVRYAQALPEIKFNVATPGEVANRKFAATDMNNHTGQLTVTEGTDSIIRLATLDADGPTGTSSTASAPSRGEPPMTTAVPQWGRMAGHPLGTRPATPGVRAVAWLMAAWCVDFAAVNVANEATGHFAEGAHAEYATALSVMDWTVSW